MYSKVAESTHILPMKPLSKGVWEESSLILRGSSWKSLLTFTIHPFKICHKKQHPFPWGFIWKKFLLSLIWSFKNYWKNATKFVGALFFQITIVIYWINSFLFSWLLHDPKMKLRSMYPPFLHAVQKYFKKLLPKFVPLQVNVT